MSRPVIYLDTQDYSRFGDVLRGKADAATETLFLALEARATAGDAIFAVSMPILGELLQYDADFRETTLCKARAVERLCGGWALAYPSRLIASEIAIAARTVGALADGDPVSVLSSDRYWYPNISELFRGLRAQIRAGIGAKVDEFGGLNRQQRRNAKRVAAKIDPAQAAAEAAPEMAAKFGLPVEVLTGSIVALLRGTITPEEASRRLFGAIAQPVTFVETYFERIESERNMPAWIGDFGRDFETRFQTLRASLQPYVDIDLMRERFETLLAEWPAKLAITTLRMADDDDLAEFGLNAERRGTLAADPAFVANVPSMTIVGQVIPAYTRQILGLTGQDTKIERSFGGDLVHALYLPHVDLWRGDRRFSAVLSGAVPSYAPRVVSTLKALPAAIDAWNTKQSLT